MNLAQRVSVIALVALLGDRAPSIPKFQAWEKWSLAIACITILAPNWKKK